MCAPKYVNLNLLFFEIHEFVLCLILSYFINSLQLQFALILLIVHAPQNFVYRIESYLKYLLYFRNLLIVVMCIGKDFPIPYDTIFSDAISDLLDLQLSLAFSRIKNHNKPKSGIFKITKQTLSLAF